MTQEQLLYWINNSIGVEKEIVADYLYENNLTQESNIVRALGQYEQGSPPKHITHLVSINSNKIVDNIQKYSTINNYYTDQEPPQTHISLNNNILQIQNDKIHDITDFSVHDHSCLVLKNDGTIYFHIRYYPISKDPITLNNIKKAELFYNHIAILFNDNSLQIIGTRSLAARLNLESGEITKEKENNHIIQNVKTITTGIYFTAFIKTDNTLHAWGTTEPIVNVINSLKEEYCQVSSQGESLIALKPDGTIQCITISKARSPILQNIIQIKSTDFANFALDLNGNVHAWNYQGRSVNTNKFKNVFHIETTRTHAVIKELIND